jgi:hypothetical protein
LRAALFSLAHLASAHLACARLSLVRHREAVNLLRGVTQIFGSTASIHGEAMNRLLERMFFPKVE